MTDEMKDLIQALKGAVDTYLYTGMDSWEREVTAERREFAERILSKYYCSAEVLCDGGDPCKKGHK